MNIYFWNEKENNKKQSALYKYNKKDFAILNFSWNLTTSLFSMKRLALDLLLSCRNQLWIHPKFRSSHQKCSVKSWWKRLCRSRGGLKLYSERNSNAGVFLQILRNFKNTFFTEHLRETTWYFTILVYCGVIITNK